MRMIDAGSASDIDQLEKVSRVGSNSWRAARSLWTPVHIASSFSGFIARHSSLVTLSCPSFFRLVLVRLCGFASRYESSRVLTGDPKLIGFAGAQGGNEGSREVGEGEPTSITTEKGKGKGRRMGIRERFGFEEKRSSPPYHTMEPGSRHLSRVVTSIIRRSGRSRSLGRVGVVGGLCLISLYASQNNMYMILRGADPSSNPSPRMSCSY